MPRNHISASQYLGSSVPAIGGHGVPMTGSRVDDKLIDDHLAVQAIIRSYQVTNESNGNLQTQFLRIKS